MFQNKSIDKKTGESKSRNRKDKEPTLISGFRRDVDEICGLLGYYNATHLIFPRPARGKM
jgi:hypothetical protein